MQHRSCIPTAGEFVQHEPCGTGVLKEAQTHQHELFDSTIAMGNQSDQKIDEVLSFITPEIDSPLRLLRHTAQNGSLVKNRTVCQHLEEIGRRLDTDLFRHYPHTTSGISTSLAATTFELSSAVKNGPSKRLKKFRL